MAVLAIVEGSLVVSEASPTLPYFDKVLHLLAYGCVAFLAVPAFPKTRLWHIVLYACLLGLGLEAAQAIMSNGRQGSGMDFIANLCGTLLGVMFWDRSLAILRRQD